MKKPRLVCVKWEDACNYVNDAVEDVKKKPPELVETYGLLFKSKNHHIIMTHSAGEGNSDFIRVPSVLVRKVVYLCPAKKKRVQS